MIDIFKGIENEDRIYRSYELKKNKALKEDEKVLIKRMMI
jgi:hypothetical protein